MRKVVALAIVLLFLGSLGAVPAFHVGYARAQEEPALWVRSYGLVSSAPGEHSMDMATAPNGDFVVVGISGGNWTADGFFNIEDGSWGSLWVLRLDPEGNIKWQKTYGIKSWGNGVAVAPNGDILVTGGIKSLNGEIQLWVLRLDPEGNIKWQKTYGSGVGKDIIVTSSDEIIVTGAFTLALDKWGNVKWAKNITGTALSFDTNSGNIVIGNGGVVTYVNYEGVVIGRKVLSNVNIGSVHVTRYGDIILAGYDENLDVAVIHLDKEGNVKWAKSYGGSNWDWANSVVVADTGDVIVAGWTSSFESRVWDLWVLKLDLGGNVYWQKRYGGKGQEGATSVVIDSEGNIVTSGFTNSFGNYYNAFWILRLPPDGSLPPEGIQDPGFSYGDTDAVIQDTDVQITDTNAVITDINAIVHDTNVEPQDTNAIVKTQYYLERGSSVGTNTIKLVVGNIPVAFADVEVWKDGQLIETATSDLEGKVSFTHEVDQAYTLRILGKEYGVSDVINLEDIRDSLFGVRLELVNITPVVKDTVRFEIIRLRDGKRYSSFGSFTPTKYSSFAVPQNEKFEMYIMDIGYPEVHFKFVSSPEVLGDEIIGSPGVKGRTLYIELPYIQPDIDEQDFTEFSPFVDGYSFANPDIPSLVNVDISLGELEFELFRGVCFGMTTTSKFNYLYTHAIGTERQLLSINSLPLKILVSYRPSKEFIEWERNSKFDVIPLDNVEFSIIFNQIIQPPSLVSSMSQTEQLITLEEYIRKDIPVELSLKGLPGAHSILAIGYVKAGDKYYIPVYDPNYPFRYSWAVIHSYEGTVFQNLPAFNVWMLKESQKYLIIQPAHLPTYQQISTNLKYKLIFSVADALKGYNILLSPVPMEVIYHDAFGTYYGEFVNGRFYQSNVPYSAGFMEWSKEDGNVEPFYAVIYPTKLDELGEVEVKTLTPPGDLDPYTVMAIGEDRVTGFSVNSTVEVTTSDDGNGYLLVANGTGNVEISKFIMTNSSYENTTLAFQGTNVTIQLNDTAVRADLNGDGVIDKTILLPEVEFTFSPGSAGINKEIIFNASESRGIESPIVNYTWNFGDGSTASGPVVTHSYSHPGIYTVTLTVTDENGTSVSLSKVIVIQPIISFVYPTPENNAVINKPYVFINITSNEPLESAFLEWNGKKIPMKKASPTNWYINMTNLKSGKYTFKVWGKDENGNWGVSDVRTVTIELPAQSKTWITTNTILTLSHLWTAWFFKYHEEFNSLYANATAMNVSNETLQRALELHNNATALILKAWHSDDINYIKEHLWKHVVFVPQIWNVRKAFLMERQAVRLILSTVNSI